MRILLGVLLFASLAFGQCGQLAFNQLTRRQDCIGSAENKVYLAVDAGSNDTYVATATPALSAYPAGTNTLVVLFTGNTSNTGAATLALNGLAAKPIYKHADGTALANNDIRAGIPILLKWDAGSNGGNGAFFVEGQLGNAAVAGSTTFDAIGSGTNETATMAVGTGASLAATGSGTITATSVAGKAGVVVTTGAGAPSAACAVPSSTHIAMYWDSTNLNLYYCSATTPTWQKFLSDGAGVAKTGATQWQGVTSGGAGFTVNDVAGTSILYILPATNGTAGKVLYDTGAAACPTLETAPTSCHQLAWTEAIGGNQTANYVLSGPASGGAAAAAFRALVSDDLPTSGVTPTKMSTAAKTRTIDCVFDGGGSPVPQNSKCYTRVPVAGTVIGWSIVAVGTNPTTTIDVWRAASGTALPTVTEEIAGTGHPALATGNALKSTVSNWTSTALAADDIIGFNVDAVSAATWIEIKVYYTGT